MAGLVSAAMHAISHVHLTLILYLSRLRAMLHVQPRTNCQPGGSGALATKQPVTAQHVHFCRLSGFVRGYPRRLDRMVPRVVHLRHTRRARPQHGIQGVRLPPNTWDPCEFETLPFAQPTVFLVIRQNSFIEMLNYATRRDQCGPVARQTPRLLMKLITLLMRVAILARA
ncbi:uncharacterized protein EI90DRAFT_3074843 [Cantharellus anzutake]|uniref:uncharacterized protein n=1 Tax=Cantharellus anzutake TaxID=1750568 RepID=UPI001907E806|nr:uncharacterized protein EI90DRAFT_3074843 [Cantharellus anzutake]KAF8324710.1 hypothetical protein EI90DRAFT_3074843 [Cantharellus anzutake]